MQANNSDRPAKSRIVSASFVEHRLRVILTLYKGTFASGSNSTTIDDLAISAKIQKLPVPDFGKASIEITNMPLDDMEKLTTLAFHPLYQKRNYVNVYAGDDVHGYTEIFAGNIVRAAADLNSTPDVKLKIEAQVGFWGRITADGATAVTRWDSGAALPPTERPLSGAHSPQRISSGVRWRKPDSLLKTGALPHSCAIPCITDHLSTRL